MLILERYQVPMPKMPNRMHLKQEIYLSNHTFMIFQVKLNGEDVRLQPLGTEGQETTKYNDRQKYALTQIGIPFGVGLKFNLGNAFNIGLETGIRKTFTDYLDDVSTTYPVTGYLQRNSQGGALAEQLSNRSIKTIDGKPSILVTDGKSVARGNPDNKDWYMFSGLTVTYTFLRPACPRW